MTRRWLAVDTGHAARATQRRAAVVVWASMHRFRKRPERGHLCVVRNDPFDQ
jgi:hypothetical protein